MFSNNPSDTEEPEFAHLRQALAEAIRIAEPFKRRLYALGVITSALAPRGIIPILVGGCAVEFYTFGGYATQDIDVVVSGRDEFDSVLRSLGFSKDTGQRHWYSEELDLAIEAPDNVLAGSRERVVTLEIDSFIVYIIGLEDLILDRLRAFVFWRSPSDGEWASRMIALHETEIDWDYLTAQAARENLGDALERVRRGIPEDA